MSFEDIPDGDLPVVQVLSAGYIYVHGFEGRMIRLGKPWFFVPVAGSNRNHREKF
jgi:hypothetical protein